MNLKLLIGEQLNEKTMATSFTAYQNATEINLTPNFGKTDSEAFTGSAYKGKSFVSTAGATGNVSFELTLETLKNLLPAFGYTVAVGTDPITEATITDIAKANTSGKIERYYTLIEQNLEDNEERILTGCQLNNVTLDISQGAYCKLTADVVGYAYEYKDSITHTGTPITDIDDLLTCITSNIEMGSTDVSAETQSVSIAINNNLEQKYGLGNRNATKITRNGFIESNATVTLNAYNKAKFKEGIEALMANDKVSLTIKMAENFNTGAGIVFIKIPNMNVTSVEMTDKNAGGGMTQNMDISYDITAGTPMSYLFGTLK